MLFSHLMLSCKITHIGCAAISTSENVLCSIHPAYISILCIVPHAQHPAHGRRRKLLKAFYNEKKKQFDISKVPDIYDSAKYDAIHNSELGLDIHDLYKVQQSIHTCWLKVSTILFWAMSICS